MSYPNTRIVILALTIGIAGPALAVGQSLNERTQPAGVVAPAQSTTPQATIVERPHRRLKAGAAAGAALMVAFTVMDARACSTGCELGSGLMFGFAMAAGIGAGAGAGLGHLADAYAATDRTLYPPPRAATNRYFPARPTIRVGPTVNQLAFRSSLLQGSQMGQGLALVWQVSPYVSAHAEYATLRGRIAAAPGSVSQAVLENMIPAPGRIAPLPAGIESRRVSFVFSNLIGVHPRPFGRVRIEFVAGLSGQAQEKRDYYPESRNVGQTRELTGKFYVLDFESPRIGVVAGADAEIAVAPGFSIVPTIRYMQRKDPGATLMAGVGGHWRF